MSKGLFSAVIAGFLLAGCGAAHVTEVRVGNTTIVNVHSSGQDLTIASGTVTTLACDARKQQCKHIATGGGVSGGGAAILGPVVGGIIATQAPVGGNISIANTAVSSSKAKSVGGGSSFVNVGVKNVAIGTGGDAENTNINK